ncbi:MAG: restriction endonuclease [Deltaproteobacteria bacterium]|nr:restriction endonuclease [Deltaproteobacteria bacterium]
MRAFYGVIIASPAAMGAFVTTSSFTRGVRKFSKSVSIACIDGTQLLRLLVRHNLWPFQIAGAFVRGEKEI